MGLPFAAHARNEEEAQLFELFDAAIVNGLADEDAVTRMIDNYRSGRFGRQHYMNLWQGRIQDAVSGVNVAAELRSVLPASEPARRQQS